MIAVRSMFFEDTETVVEFWPGEGEAMKFDPAARHLWQRTYSAFPMPVKKVAEC